MRARLPRAAALVLGFAFVASCGGAGGEDLDSGAVDGGAAVDASTPDASGADSSVVEPDAAPADAAPADAAPADAAAFDAGAADASSWDAAASDAASVDASPADAMPPPDADPSIIEENEPDGTRVNDEFVTRVPISVGRTVHGAVGSLTVDLVPDWDVYGFSATAGTTLRLTLSARDAADYQALALVSDEAGYARMAVGVAEPNTATRELFIPTNGYYYVTVGDFRNFADPTVGGPGLTYALTITEVTPTMTSVEVPVARADYALPPDHALRIASFSGSAGAAITAETFASRLPAPSDVDTVVYIVDATNPSAPQVLAFSDDIDTSAGNYDSLAEAVLARSGEHWVVLDHYMIFGNDRTVELSIGP